MKSAQEAFSCAEFGAATVLALPKPGLDRYDPMLVEV